MLNQTTQAIVISIPAYSANQQAHLVTLTLKASLSHTRTIQTIGPVAKALHRALNRTIEIMSILKPEWAILSSCNYTLQHETAHLVVKDTRSAGLPLCIALITLYRQFHQKSVSYTPIGTGLLRNDGSFQSTEKEEVKQKILNHQQLITANTCSHVFYLNTLMEEKNAS